MHRLRICEFINCFDDILSSGLLVILLVEIFLTFNACNNIQCWVFSFYKKGLISDYLCDFAVRTFSMSLDTYFFVSRDKYLPENAITKRKFIEDDHIIPCPIVY